MVSMVSATSVTEGIRVILTYVEEFLILSIFGLFVAVGLFVIQDAFDDEKVPNEYERKYQNNQTNRKDK